MKCLKIIVVGYGSIGKRHVQNLLTMKNIEIIICTKQKIKNLSKNIHVCSSITKCINEKPDMAIISNESSLHIKSAKIFADAGIDLFIEKPLTNSLDETKKLVGQQKELMGALNGMAPVLQNAKKTLENLDMPDLKNLQGMMATLNKAK